MTDAILHAWRALAELLRLLHYGQTCAAVAACEQAVGRSLDDLGAAILARDRALAAIRVHDGRPTQDIPAFLLKGSAPAVVGDPQ